MDIRVKTGQLRKYVVSSGKHIGANLVVPRSAQHFSVLNVVRRDWIKKKVSIQQIEWEGGDHVVKLIYLPLNVFFRIIYC